MRKLVVFLMSVFVLLPMAKADDDKPIAVSELPQAAQVFIQKHFAGKEVVFAKMDKGLMFVDDYEVMFNDGSKVKFDKDGNWEDVECRDMPTAIIPAQIAEKAKSLYATAKIISIERDRKGFEVKLDNRLELKFDKSFNLYDIDD